MKNLLITTALLAGTASMAYAETGVSFSGYGRFGLVYNDGAAPGVKEMQISSRLRFNINAKTETDSGVTFGGRIRLQYSSNSTSGSRVTSTSSVVTPGATAGDPPTVVTTNTFATESGAVLSPAYVYGEYNGVRVEVGNANTAYDSAALMYNSEIGFLDRSTGDPQGAYYSFSSDPYTNEPNRMGVFASYSVGDFNGRISYVTEDQTVDSADEEISISADYTFGQFTVSAAAAQDGAGIEGNDLYFIGAAYSVNDQANVGLLYFDEDTAGTTITLYGNYTFGATTVRGYVANNDRVANDDDTTFGIGADYDLGGARLSGAVFTDYDGDLNADMGVRFDF